MTIPNDPAALVMSWREIADQCEVVVGPLSDGQISTLMDCGDRLASAIEAVLAREAALREAVAPLVYAVADGLESDDADDDPVDWFEWAACMRRLKIADVRAARAALAKQEPMP
jgi:hypothetical protein